MAYENTTVAVAKSQEELRSLLTKHGAQRFTFGESIDDDGTRWVGVEFVHDGHLVRLVAPLKEPDVNWLARKTRNARTRTKADFEAEHYEQEAKRIWRVLLWSLKARMVAIEEGVESFEQAFLAHLVDPQDNRTLWTRVEPAIRDGRMRINGPGLPELTERASR